MREQDLSVGKVYAGKCGVRFRYFIRGGSTGKVHFHQVKIYPSGRSRIDPRASIEVAISPRAFARWASRIAVPREAEMVRGVLQAAGVLDGSSIPHEADPHEAEEKRSSAEPGDPGGAVWLVYVPGNGWEEFDSEQEARDAMDRVADELREEAGDGWNEEAESLVMYRAVPVAAFKLTRTAAPGDGTADGEWCKANDWDFMARGAVVECGSSALGRTVDHPPSPTGPSTEDPSRAAVSPLWVKVAGHNVKPPRGMAVFVARHSHLLVWGAEKDADGEIRAALYEYTGEVTMGGDVDPERWEPAIYSAIHAGELSIQFECNCSPGGLCRKHGDEAAREWWAEAKRRRAEGDL